MPPVLIVLLCKTREGEKTSKTNKWVKMPKKDSTVKHSVQDGGSSLKPCQTFEKAAFFCSLLKNWLPIHSIKKSAHTYTNVPQKQSHTTHTRLSRLLKCWQMPSDRQAGTVDQSEVNDGEGGGGKRDRGVRDNNQMNDRIQVFGFARQPLGCLHSLQQPMVSDYSSVIGRQSQGARQRLGEMINRRGGGREEGEDQVEKEVFDRKWERVLYINVPLPLLLTFGWTFCGILPHDFSPVLSEKERLGTRECNKGEGWEENTQARKKM